MMKIKLFLMFALLFMFSRVSFAEPNGTCWTDPPRIYVITFGSAKFKSNKAGTSVTLTFGNTDRYNITCAPNPAQLPLYYNKGDFGPGSSSSGSVLHVSDMLDATVTLNVTNGSSPKTLPFNDYVSSGAITPAAGGGVVDTGYAGSGKVTFTLLKDAIGGAVIVPPGVYMFRSYRSVYSGTYATQPSTQGYTAGQILPVDATCTINNGTTVTVPFGDIDSSQLKHDGPSSVIKKDIALTYSCSTSLTQDIEITLMAAPSGFESTAIASNNANIGVVMMYNGTPVAPQGHFFTKLVSGKGNDTVTFSPIIKEGAENVQGSFSASATLVMTSA